MSIPDYDNEPTFAKRYIAPMMADSEPFHEDEPDDEIVMMNVQEVEQLRASLRAATAEAARLHEALERYGTHDVTCAVEFIDGAGIEVDCTCGFDVWQRAATPPATETAREFSEFDCGCYWTYSAERGVESTMCLAHLRVPVGEGQDG
jgi:hypothetical protein